MPGINDNCRRKDGLSVLIHPGGQWIIKPTGGRPMINWCPCCGATFKSAAEAMAVADKIYPQTEMAMP